MTDIEAAQLVDRIAATWRGRLSHAERAVWAEALSDLDHQAAVAAVDNLANTAARRPSLADIRRAATPTSAGTSGKPGPDGWQVLAHWTDAKGNPWTAQSWHTSETEARQAFIRAQAKGDHPKTVELLQHSEYKPVVLLDSTAVA